jgi:hypothetical protein
MASERDLAVGRARLRVFLPAVCAASVTGPESGCRRRIARPARGMAGVIAPAVTQFGGIFSNICNDGSMVSQA